MRRGEIAGLRWCDVDFDAGTITVARSRVELGGGPTTVVENEPKTLASRRTLPLDEGLLAVLRRDPARSAHSYSAAPALLLQTVAYLESAATADAHREPRQASAWPGFFCARNQEGPPGADWRKHPRWLRVRLPGSVSPFTANNT
jgi:integrase